jgi:hypothetical protein
VSIGSRTEHPSQRRNATGQAALFDSNPGPDAIEQILLRKQTTRVLNKHGQQIEHLRRERDNLRTEQKLALLLIEAVPIEDEEVLG